VDDIDLTSKEVKDLVKIFQGLKSTDERRKFFNDPANAVLKRIFHSVHYPPIETAPTPQ
jgi:hypothetical protein